MLGYLSADIICFEKRTVFRERVSFEEQIMSKDKYPSIFFATLAVLKIGEYLTIRLRARVVYEQIVNDTQPSLENEGE